MLENAHAADLVGIRARGAHQQIVAVESYAFNSELQLYEVNDLHTACSFVLYQQVSRRDFNQHIKPHLRERMKEPKPKLSFYK